MSNQQITTLESLVAKEVNPYDLLLIVDTDDYSGNNGTAKNITVNELGTYFNFSIKTLEETISQSNHGFSVGQVLRIDLTSSLYVTSSANTTTGEQSEVVGVIQNIIDENNFVLIYEGVLNFNSGSLPSWASSGMLPGQNYFLVDGGNLSNQDPTANQYPSWVSKPVLIAVNPYKAIIDKQRGFYRPNFKETEVTKHYVTGSNSFVIGDVLRKTLTSETSSLGQWTLASSDTYNSAQVVGIVSERSANYFAISLTGKVNTLSNLKVGSTYYLLPSGSFNTDISNINQRNVSSVEPISSVLYPIYIAISPTEAVLTKSTVNLNTSLYYNVSPLTYGPFPYISQVAPDTGSIVNMIENILPNAKINETAEVYWQYNDLGKSKNAPVQTQNWSLQMTTQGWSIT